jgi:hypothetical protein
MGLVFYDERSDFDRGNNVGLGKRVELYNWGLAGIGL